MHLALAHPFSFFHYRSIFITSYTRLPAASLKKARSHVLLYTFHAILLSVFETLKPQKSRNKFTLRASSTSCVFFWMAEIRVP